MLDYLVYGKDIIERKKEYIIQKNYKKNHFMLIEIY